MLRHWKLRFAGGESGQAIIFVAVMSAAILGIVGMAVEGGRALVEYRQMQVAADMAALVGSQDAGCNSTDTTCITDAEQAACNWAMKNGFGGGWDVANNNCTPAGGATVAVSIPPNTCSPYSFDYDNGKSVSNGCLATSTASRYDYVEVEITQDLGTVPIFGTHVTEYTHAVARKGTHSPRDYAIAVLDPSISKALDMGGSAQQLYVVGSVQSNSSSSLSINAGGSHNFTTCGGGWYTSSTSETSAPSGLASYQGGAAYFAPPGCTGTQDSTVGWYPGQEAIPDPYAAVGAPGAASGGFGGYCAPCGSLGHYYHWTTSQGRSGGTWDDSSRGAGYPGSSAKNDNYEFFPGQYPGGITVNNGNDYFNPGFYGLGGSPGLKVTGGNICVFGAPICDQFSGGNLPGTAETCATAQMRGTSAPYTDPNVNPAEWYYYCSPWGTWDTWLAKPPTFGLSTPPTFTDSSTRLNGVTFYELGCSTYSDSSPCSNGSGLDVSGNGTMSLTFPDPCPGTGGTNWSTGSVPFQAVVGQGSSGSAAAYYTYPTGSLPGASQTSPAGTLYPNSDLTVDGENACRATLNSGNTEGNIPDAWPGEFQASSAASTGQLLHFIVFLRDTKAGISLQGGGTQLWWGIVYNPGNFQTTGGCAAQSSGCLIKLAGSSGTNGPPMMVGQLIGDGVSIGGSATTEVFYRPCNARIANCEPGPGSTLIQ